MSLNQQAIAFNAEIIWQYHLLNHQLKRSDCILGLGSNDIRVAQRAAELYLQGYAPLIVFSGAVGKLTKGLFQQSEAAQFAQIAIEMGVPESAILIEDKATNTGENIQYIQALLKDKGQQPQSYIVVQKPFMERRSLAVFRKYIPTAPLIVTSPQSTLADYVNEHLSYEHILNVMVGDLQRIKEYPALGFQIEQTIPDNVWDAFEKLVDCGFTTHLINGS